MLKKMEGEFSKELAREMVKEKWKLGGRVAEQIQIMEPISKRDKDSDEMMKLLKTLDSKENKVDRMRLLKIFYVESENILPEKWRKWIEKQIEDNEQEKDASPCYKDFHPTGDCSTDFLSKREILVWNSPRLSLMNKLKREDLEIVVEMAFQARYLEAIAKIDEIDDPNAKAFLLLSVANKVGKGSKGKTATKEEKYDWFYSGKYGEHCNRTCVP